MRTPPISDNGTICHCDVLKIRQAGSAVGSALREENPLLWRGRKAEEIRGTQNGQTTSVNPHYFAGRFSSNLFFRVLCSKNGLWSYVKAVDGVRGPPQSPVSQAEKVQSTTGDSQHSVPAKMQPPSPSRQPNAFDVPSVDRRRTQAHSRYGFKTELVFFPAFQGGCHGGGGLGGVEWIAS